MLEMENTKRKPNLAKVALILITVLNLLIFVAYLVIGLTVFGGATCSDNQETLFANGRGQVKTYSGRVVHDFQTKEMAVYEDASQSKPPLLKGSFSRRVDFNDYASLNVQRLDPYQEGWANDYVYKFTAKSRAADLEFSMQHKNATTAENTNDKVSCDSYEWRVTNQNDHFADQEFEDCFELTDGVYWYGQTESKNQQYWPINKIAWTGYKVI